MRELGWRTGEGSHTSRRSPVAVFDRLRLLEAKFRQEAHALRNLYPLRYLMSIDQPNRALDATAKRFIPSTLPRSWRMFEAKAFCQVVYRLHDP